MSGIIIHFEQLTLRPAVIHSQKLLKINIGFLLNASVGTFRDIHFDELNVRLPDDLELTDFKGLIRFTRTGEGLLLTGNFTAYIAAECGRCLETYPQVLNIQLTELYHFRNRIMKESDLVIPEGGIIDLAPLLVEYFILEIPINPVCTPDCRGLCPECGANLNVETCVHVAEPG